MQTLLGHCKCHKVSQTLQVLQMPNTASVTNTAACWRPFLGGYFFLLTENDPSVTNVKDCSMLTSTSRADCSPRHCQRPAIKIYYFRKLLKKGRQKICSRFDPLRR